MIINIKGNYSLEGLTGKCFGTIEILINSKKLYYVSWKLSDENGNIIYGKSKEYYVDNSQPFDQERLIKIVITDIEKAKIRREKVFFSIQLV